MQYFKDDQIFTGDVYLQEYAKNAAGQTVKTETLVQPSLKFAAWADRGVQSLISDQFVKDEVGYLIVDPIDTDIEFTNKHLIKTTEKTFYINFADDVQGFGDHWELLYSAERK